MTVPSQVINRNHQIFPNNCIFHHKFKNFNEKNLEMNCNSIGRPLLPINISLSFIEISDDLLERKIELCQELLQVADILEPGFSKFRGLLLHDMQAAIVVQAKRRYENGELSREDVEVG